VTKGGYTHDQVDQAGLLLLQAVQTELQTQASAFKSPQLTIGVSSFGAPFPSPLPRYRPPLVQGANAVSVSLMTKPPASASLNQIFALFVPTDCGREDDLVLDFVLSQNNLTQTSQPNDSQRFAARVDDVLPSISSVLQLRIRMFVESIFSNVLHSLAEAARVSYQK
jgi:hypothetical protein